MKRKTQEKLAEATAALEAKRAEAKTLWVNLEDAKAKAISAGAEALAEGSPAFVALDEAGAAYDTVQDEFHRMEAAYNRMVEAVDGEAPRAAGALPGENLRTVDPQDAESVFASNIEAFMTGFRGWAEQIGEQTLKNPKGRFGNSPEFTLIRRDDFRNAITQTTAFPSISTRRPGIVPLIRETVELIDVIPWVPVDHETVEYVYEKTFTNTAVEKAETVAAAEGVIELDVASTVCKWIPFTIPATRQLLSDESRMRSFITERGVYGVRQRLQTQLISGNAEGQNLRGILNWANILSMDALGSYAITDLVHRAKTRIRIQTKGMYEPNVLLMHPADEEKLTLAKATEDGHYYFGGPQREGFTVWGMRPISHVSIPEGEPIVADINACEGYIREDVSLSVTDSHDDHFTRGIIDFLASGRFGFAILEPKAFCTIPAFAS